MARIVKPSRPRAGLGLSSAMTSDRTITRSAKPDRNRNRVTSAKPAAVARRGDRKQ